MKHRKVFRVLICGDDWECREYIRESRVYHLKESIQTDLPAHARFVTEPEERRQILSAPVMAWYHNQVNDVEGLITGSPLIEVIFETS